MTTPPDDFYVGYRPRLPGARGYARFVLAAAQAIALASVVVALVLTALQRDPGAGRHEFGQFRTLTGTVYAEPLPLLLADPAPGFADTPRWLVLVDQGKHGAGPRIDPVAGRRATIRGTLIERGGVGMFEVAPGDAALVPDEADPPSSPPASRTAPIADAGPVRVAGEIVDAKCFLGVMKPGSGKVHRMCAARCISGGVPAALAVRRTDPDREAQAGEDFSYYLLVDVQGRPVSQTVLPFVGERVEIDGTAWTLPGETTGRLLGLRFDPGSVRRQ